MTWQLGIIAIDNLFHFFLGSSEGVYATASGTTSLPLAPQLESLATEWNLAGTLPDQIYLAVAPSYKHLLPPQWRLLHIRKRAYPLNRQLPVPKSLREKISLLELLDDVPPEQEDISQQIAATNLISLITPFAYLFPEQEEAWLRRIRKINPNAQIHSIPNFPIPNFLLRERCLIHQALVTTFFNNWRREIGMVFPKLRQIWWVEDEAMLWEEKSAIPLGSGLHVDQVLEYLLLRGSMARKGLDNGVALFRRDNNWLAVKAYDFKLNIEPESYQPLTYSPSSLKRTLKKEQFNHHSPIIVFNFTGEKLDLDYPYMEELIMPSPSLMGLGLFNTPRRVIRYALANKKERIQVKEQLESQLQALNDNYALFPSPHLICEEMPLRYLPDAGSLLKISLAP